MIQKLTLENFQSHELTQLEFDPGINVIVGPSDSGKSAILRALKWAAWNTPSGEAFRSSWGGDTTVQLFAEEDLITRSKGKENLYFLNGLKFKAFGAGDPPEEIVAALNLNEINIQQQLDRPFLLDDSPGKVAQHFNSVAHLDAIDQGLQNVQKWLRELDRDIKTEARQIEELEEDLVQYEGLEKIEVDIAVAETLSQQIQSDTRKIPKLQRLIVGINQATEHIQTANEKIKFEVPVLLALGHVKELKKLKKQENSLFDIIHEIIDLQKILPEFQHRIDLGKRVDETLQDIKIFQKDQKKVEKLEGVISKFMKAQETVKLYQEEIKKREEDFKKAFPDICPLCGQEVK